MKLTDRKVAATPIIMVAVMVVFYMAFQLTYIGCHSQHYLGDGQFFKCTSVDVGLVFNQPREDALFLQTKKPEGVRTMFAERYSGRQMWVFITFVSVIVCVGVFVVSAFLIHKSASFRGETPFFRTTVFIGVAILLGVVLWRWPDFYMNKLQGVLDHTVSVGYGGVPAVIVVMEFAIAFTFAATFTLIFAACAILLPRAARTPVGNGETDAAAEGETEKVRFQLKPISAQMADLHLMLYAGTILLVVGVLRLSSAYRWSLAFVSLESAQAKVVETFISSLVSDVGGFFTLVLAVVYVPAAYILHKRAQLIVEQSALPQKEGEEILKDRGFTFSIKEALPSSFLILSPTLAGPIGDLFRTWPS